MLFSYQDQVLSPSDEDCDDEISPRRKSKEFITDGTVPSPSNACVGSKAMQTAKGNAIKTASY